MPVTVNQEHNLNLCCRTTVGQALALKASNKSLVFH